MKTVRIDGKDYEIGSEAHLDKLAQMSDAAVKVEKDRADTADAALKLANETASKAKADHEAALAAEKARADKAEAEVKTIPKRVAEGVRVQMFAAKAGVTKVTKDGKEVDVADADMTSVLLAIAKKAMPEIDVAKLNLTPEQLLELIAQKVGATSEAPAPTDGDMPEEEQEMPTDSRGAPRGDSFDVLARIEGRGNVGKKAAKRSYQDSHDAMRERLRNAHERKTN